MYYDEATGMMVEQIKIETYWNVNISAIEPDHVACGIKIETYWNVNDDKTISIGLNQFIKIETYWNVNRGVRQLDYK